MKNKLYCGDNLEIMKSIPEKSVDLICTDPPYNSNRDYNDFDDRWDSDENYLNFMKLRLVEMHRLLKDTGSLYLHCDPTMSHYLKVELDKIFGKKNFRTEIIWHRHKGSKNTGKNLANNFDVIFRYTKSDKFTFNKSAITSDYTDEQLKKYYRFEDPDGRRWASCALKSWHNNQTSGYEYTIFGITDRWTWPEERMRKEIEKGIVFQTKPGTLPRYKKYLDEADGKLLDNVWLDIPNKGGGKENEGYPTQKPLALLIRLIRLCSNKGDLVLDPFCGSGTTIDASDELGRLYIGIDKNPEAIKLTKKRIEKNYSLFEDY